MNSFDIPDIALSRKLVGPACFSALAIFLAYWWVTGDYESAYELYNSLAQAIIMPIVEKFIGISTFLVDLVMDALISSIRASLIN